MKGKMFKYICSLLLLFVVLSGNSQTINGRLYTQFNNYYKWRGGAFDSVLLLPNLTGTAGLRGGALRYNGADSSLYVYTGTQWRKIDGSGSGSTPTLEMVTDVGNTTSNNIEFLNSAEAIFGSTGGILLNNGSRLRQGTIDAGYGGSKGIAQICAVGYELKWEAGRLYVMGDGGTTIREVRYTFTSTPTASDDITKGFLVGSRWVLDNGDVYVCSDNSAGAAAWSLLTNSTPTLQQVTDQGNSTTNDIFLTGISLFKSAAGPGNSVGNIVLKSTYNGDSISINNRHLYWNLTGSNFRTGISTNAPTQNNSLALPDSSGTLPLRVKLNSTTYAPASNGTIDLGTISSDTATVVKAYVTNAESVTITKGQVVYIFGASGDRASVKLAKNTSDTFSSKTLGIVRENIAAGQAGWITTQGQVSGINLGAYTPGDILWLDSIPGSFTSTKPQAPYHAVFLGVVERANVGNGLIYVKPANGVELDELHDVRITSLANNEIIRYNSALGYWENKSITTTLGYTPLNVTDTTAMLSPYLRSNVANATYQLQLDTVPLVSFGAGSGAAGDTSAFSVSAVYGSFYNDGSDTLIITQMRAGVLGTSPSIRTEIYWNDSLNITAGATILVSGGTSVTGTIGATNVTSFTNNKIPPGVWVFCRTSAVATKPTYFTLTLLGYKKRK